MMDLIDLFVFTPVTETEQQLPVYMCGAGYLSNQYPISRPNGFQYFQWIQCVSGEGRLITEGQTQTVKANQVMLLFPDSPHEYYATQEPWGIHWFNFGGHAVESIIRVAGITTSGAYTVSHGDVLLTHLKNAYAVAQSKRGLVGLECAKLAYMMLLDLMRYITFNDDSLDQRYAKLQPVFEYIEKNYADVITSTDLSQTMGITSQHLCLLFRNLVAMRPIEYLNWFRIDKSKELIFRYRDKKIHEISRMVGIQDHRYFSKLFRKIEGMTPEAFKKLNGI